MKRPTRAPRQCIWAAPPPQPHVPQASDTSFPGRWSASFSSDGSKCHTYLIPGNRRHRPTIRVGLTSTGEIARIIQACEITGNDAKQTSRDNLASSNPHDLMNTTSKRGLGKVTYGGSFDTCTIFKPGRRTKNGGIKTNIGQFRGKITWDKRPWSERHGEAHKKKVNEYLALPPNAWMKREHHRTSVLKNEFVQLSAGGKYLQILTTPAVIHLIEIEPEDIDDNKVVAFACALGKPIDEQQHWHPGHANRYGRTLRKTIYTLLLLAKTRLPNGDTVVHDKKRRSNMPSETAKKNHVWGKIGTAP